MKIVSSLLFVFLFASCKGYTQSAVMNKNGKSDYVIVLPDKSSDIEQKAARTFQDFFLRSTGIKLPVVKESTAKAVAGINIGNTAAYKKLSIAGSNKPDGFVIYRKGDNVFINGNGGKGTLYGVYSFLERYLDINCLAPDFYDIPKGKEIVLPAGINIRENPVFEIRDVYTDIAYDSAYASWHKNERLLLNKDKKMGTFVHTFLRMVPPAKFFKTHPEYYAYNKGKRAPTQLCMSNENVVKIFTDTLRKMMAIYPVSKFWSVSQEDLGDFCHCDNCEKAYAKYGNKISGLMIEFVNKVAVNFPDKYITTLAYHETTEPPANIKPAGNVVIYYAPIDAFHGKGYTKDPANAKYVTYLKGWRALTGNLFFWDYISNYTDILAPYPNIGTYKDNILLFRNTGVKYVYEQGINQPGGELKELKTFLLCKLLWNPDYDQDSLTNLFCQKYYGKGAPFVLRYLQAIQGNLSKENVKLGCFGPADQYKGSYLKPAYLGQYDGLLASAASAVANNKTYLDNVNKLRVSLDYYILKTNDNNSSFGLRSASTGNNNSERIQRFKENIKKENIRYMRDQKQDPIETLVKTL